MIVMHVLLVATLVFMELACIIMGAVGGFLYLKHLKEEWRDDPIGVIFVAPLSMAFVCLYLLFIWFIGLVIGSLAL